MHKGETVKVIAAPADEEYSKHIGETGIIQRVAPGLTSQNVEIYPPVALVQFASGEQAAYRFDELEKPS